MALTPMQFGKKEEKKTGWDIVAQAMQMANAAVGVATGVDNLTKSATVPTGPANQVPEPGANYTPPAEAPMQPGANPMNPMKTTNVISRRFGMYA